MEERKDSEVTRLLLAWSGGDEKALEQLLPLVHDRLRRLAASYLRHERGDHTLQTLALVNEAYMRLVDQRAVRWRDRAHFFAIAARMMRRILVDHARRLSYAKRGGGEWQRVDMDELERPGGIVESQHPEVVALDDALRDLEARDPLLARLVEVRYFGGLNKEEIAEVLGISSATVTRRWRVAKAWLYSYLVEGEPIEL